MAKKKQYTIRIERDVEDHILPKGFFNILVNRFLPVISLTYIGSIIGVAGNRGDFIHYMFKDNTAYIMSLFVVIWVSVPAIIWMILYGNPLFKHVADIWYKILAALMVITIAVSYLLFPEGDIYGLRLYFVASIPVLLLTYILFVKGGLPSIAAYPLNALGVCAFLYGAVINVFF